MDKYIARDAINAFAPQCTNGIDHADTYPASTVINLTHSDGAVVLAQIQVASEPGAHYWTIMYERSGGVVTIR